MFPLFFSQCDPYDTKRSSKYVKSTIDGKEYWSLKHFTPFIEPPHPDVSYKYDGGKGAISLFTSCLPRDIKKVPEGVMFNLEFMIFLNNPLKINTKYKVKSLPGKNYLMPYGSEEEYSKDRISYSTLRTSNAMKDYSFGDGFVEFTKVDGDILEGIFEFDFQFSMDKSENAKTVEVTGEFRYTNR